MWRDYPMSWSWKVIPLYFPKKQTKQKMLQYYKKYLIWALLDCGRKLLKLTFQSISSIWNQPQIHTWNIRLSQKNSVTTHESVEYKGRSKIVFWDSPNNIPFFSYKVLTWGILFDISRHWRQRGSTKDHLSIQCFSSTLASITTWTTHNFIGRVYRIIFLCYYFRYTA